MTTCKELSSTEDKMGDEKTNLSRGNTSGGKTSQSEEKVCDGKTNQSKHKTNNEEKSQSEDNSWHWSDDNEDSSTNDDDTGTFEITDRKYGKSLARKLHGMQCEDYMCDFTLKAEADGATFRVHKIVLALSSDFFKRLFEYEPSRTELTLECDSTPLQSLVNFIYTGKVRGNSEDFFEVFRVADCYQIQSFQTEWLKHFENYWVNERRLIGALQESGQRQMTPISNVCIDYLLKHMSHKTFTDELLEVMSAEVFADVLSREGVLTADSSGVLPLGQRFEFRLWQHLRRWLELHPEDRQRSLTRLAKAINFPCFTRPQLEAVEEDCATLGDLHFPDEALNSPAGPAAWANLVQKRQFCKPHHRKTVTQSEYRFYVTHVESEAPELEQVLRRIEFFVGSNNAIHGIRQCFETIDLFRRSGEADHVIDVGDTSGEALLAVQLEDNERIVAVRGETEGILVQVVLETSAGRSITVPEGRDSVVVDHKDFIFKTPFFMTQAKRLETYFSFVHSIGGRLDTNAGGLVDLRFHWASYSDDLPTNDFCIRSIPETLSHTFSQEYSSYSDYSMSVDHFMYGELGDLDFYDQYSD